jgi:acetyl esterase/lipase
MHRCCLWLIACGIAAGWSEAPGVSAQASVTPAAPVVRTYREVDGADLKLHIFAPARAAQSGPAPVMLLFHGGGWVAGAPDWTFVSARRYADIGMVAVSVQYRLSDDRVTPVDALADLCHAFQWMRAQARALRIDPHRIAAYGVSAGGHLAAAAATIGCGNTEGTYGTGGPDALVLWSPALDVGRDGHFRRLLRGRAEAEAYSPVEHVRTRMPPVHIVHGERDTLTPVSGARLFCERVKSRGGRCDLVVYPGVGHLLTRNLANQESDFDPDPAARDDGNAKQLAFVKSLWTR